MSLVYYITQTSSIIKYQLPYTYLTNSSETSPSPEAAHTHHPDPTCSHRSTDKGLRGCVRGASQGGELLISFFKETLVC